MSRSKEEIHKITIICPFCSTPINLYVRRMGREMVPRVKDIKNSVSLDFVEEYTREGRQGNFKISKLIHFHH